VDFCAGNYDSRPALEKAFRISVDMGGFSSLVASQIPSLKFSPFPLAFMIPNPNGKVDF
jgi:hypothetical protein